ncbi:MAG: family 78 glycoside hydrolase catalytic domain, partial [Defluviitaleaceae bacterium]|nr:family 78 glycoside hydrolase catalytic domain [Defluviitaleaceae bacterium]
MSEIHVSNLLCGHFQNPLGCLIEDNFHLSWVLENHGNLDIEMQVEIFGNEDYSELLFDSGRRRDIDPLHFAPQITLAPRQRYFWRVTAFAGDAQTQASAWFETAKQNEPWLAKWISPAEKPARHPVLFSDIDLPQGIKSARAYICGLGVYRLAINGGIAGDEALAPGLCAYDKWLPYQTYDITDLLKSGKNNVAIELGNGWYKGRYGLDRTRDFRYGDTFAAICEIYVLYEDGSEGVFVTDKNWRGRLSNIVDSSIFDGEHRDDTADCTEIFPASESAENFAPLQARRTAPSRIMHRLAPIEIIHTPAGEVVLDMGQNMVGQLAFRNRAPRGAKVELQFGEVMQNGNFYRDNLRTALAEYSYISDGVDKIICQYFTFYGFRYVKLTQWHQDINIDDFEGLVLYTDMPQTGYLTTSNEKVNKLIENTIWGQRGNFLDVPTDCPQRDERMGWTGDAQVFFTTSAFNMDVASFFGKYCYDLAMEQAAIGGTIPVTIPKHDVGRTGACAWGDAATIIPWNHYVMYGDAGILARQYPSMRAWVDFIRRRDIEMGDEKLWRGDFHFGDWLALDVEDSIGNRFGGTEHTYLASCFYCYSARLVAKAAAVLGKDEAAHYAELSEAIRTAINREYVTSSGRLAITTQTAYILALHFDIIDEKFRERTAHALSLKLKESGFHLRTGFIGTPYLCRVLSKEGYNNIAYRLLLQEDFPSWLYAVNMGATTIWERWNSILSDGSISDTGMNSLNHYAYGSIVEWLYRDAAGIEPDEEHP